MKWKKPWKNWKFCGMNRTPEIISEVDFSLMIEFMNEIRVKF